ncbi:MAG: penicillin-binding protein 2 [Phycisphaera sp.]|nr:penicillin-binding protein 2 [Phycisphaera sp.]
MSPPVDDSLIAQQRRTWVIARLLIAVIVVALLALLGRVLQLQVQPDARILAMVNQRGGTEQLHPRRGALLDRAGRELAVTEVGYKLFVDPGLIKDPADFPVKLAHAIGDNPARLDMMIDQRADSRYVVINDLLTDQQLDSVRKADMRGVGLELRSVRSYPHGALAAQVVGFVGSEHKGLDGLEYALDSVLRGQSGKLRTLRDARRRALWIERADYTPARDGLAIKLSLDLVIQSIAEQELARACEKFRADRAEAIVMDAHNGQLLAMANWPPFDLNNPQDAEEEVKRNRCVTDPYEPGSIFKPFIHSAITDAGVVKPDEKIDCTTTGFWATSYGRRLHDAHGHGLISWDEVLVVSSNIGMAKVAERLGDRKLFQALGDFGFGESTGVGLTGESRGIVNPLNKWTSYSKSSVPMGQEVAVTPIQLVKAFSAFANGGMMVSPSILADESDTPMYQRAISPATAMHTRMVMRDVVTEGTGRMAKSKLYQIWGKTGTAQVPVNGHYPDGLYTASFICGAPLRNPRVIVLVTVHRPDPKVGHYGGVVSAPVAKEIVEQTLPYLGVAPDMEQEVDKSRVVSR